MNALFCVNSILVILYRVKVGLCWGNILIWVLCSQMLCDDCDHFLEIAEAIRSLGLTVMKGITDNQGDKTWMRFVVEVSLSLVS